MITQYAPLCLDYHVVFEAFDINEPNAKINMSKNNKPDRLTKDLIREKTFKLKWLPQGFWLIAAPQARNAICYLGGVSESLLVS